jgi:hypothetical protein
MRGLWALLCAISMADASNSSMGSKKPPMNSQASFERARSKRKASMDANTGDKKQSGYMKLKASHEKLTQQAAAHDATCARELDAVAESNDASCAATVSATALLHQLDKDELRGVVGAAAHAAGHAQGVSDSDSYFARRAVLVGARAADAGAELNQTIVACDQTISRATRRSWCATRSRRCAESCALPRRRRACDHAPRRREHQPRSFSSKKTSLSLSPRHVCDPPPREKVGVLERRHRAASAARRLREPQRVRPPASLSLSLSARAARLSISLTETLTHADAHTRRIAPLGNPTARARSLARWLSEKLGSLCGRRFLGSINIIIVKFS